MLPFPTALSPASDVIGRFAFHATRIPEKTAVVDGSLSLNYRELEFRSDRLANHLMDSGVKKGDFIGIGLPRSIELIVAILAVLKSGAAYIPIDPSYPAERIGHMITSAGLRHVITLAGLEDRFGNVPFTTAVDRLPFAGNGNITATHIERNEEDFIYAIFTSGSTGIPKAASVFHKGFSNLIDWYTAELGLGPDDVTLVISSPSFDLTQKNFFAPLATGGTMVLDHGDHYDIHRITSLVRDTRATLLNCTPSAFYPLVEAAASAGYQDLSTLRFVVLGGEPISIPRLRDWLNHPSCRAEVVNSYGPTECTDICAFHRLHAGNLDDHRFVPTGREVPNTSVSIRDENLNPLPDGETGELCIGGIGVGGGYLHDPERTRERFTQGIYRSGDLARRLPDGIIEFRGRADQQVKVNGFRIELGEIELALATHPWVREAVVVADEGTLTAHVQGDANPDILREHLAAKLPSYIIPTRFIFVQEFPLTPNGKVDRKALVRATVAESRPPSPPSSGNPLEARILALWSELLGSPVHDATANFFDLGGTSIHLAVVHVRLREWTGSDINITDLFAHTSARSLAAHLSPSSTTPSDSSNQNRARMQQAGFARFRRPNQP